MAMVNVPQEWFDKSIDLASKVQSLEEEVCRLNREISYLNVRLKNFQDPKNEELVKLFENFFSSKEGTDERKFFYNKIRSYLNGIDKIQKIKLVKDITGMSVCRSKEFVEGYVK
jgi:ribosomal protein L7/L12